MSFQVPLPVWIVALVLFFGGWKHCFHGRFGRGALVNFPRGTCPG